MSAAEGQRANSSQKAPDPSRVTAAFPSVKVPAGLPVFRVSGTNVKTGVPNGYGWFASNPDGRFNLDPPGGTCYVALSDYTAAWESVGKKMAAAREIPQVLTDRLWLWSLVLTSTLRPADLQGDGANAAGVTSELDGAGFEDYSIPRQWAALFNDLGFDGISYRSRFGSSGPRAAPAVAIFGDERQHNGPLAETDPTASPVTVTSRAAEFGIVVALPYAATPPPTVVELI